MSITGHKRRSAAQLFVVRVYAFVSTAVKAHSELFSNPKTVFLLFIIFNDLIFHCALPCLRKILFFGYFRIQASLIDFVASNNFARTLLNNFYFHGFSPSCV